jgi:hypothetical protein
MIDSITKNRISREDIEAALIPVLGEKPSTINELHEGMFNAAYSVELENGKKYVLKVAPSPKVTLLHYEKDLIHTEVMTLKLLEKKHLSPYPMYSTFLKGEKNWVTHPGFLWIFWKGYLITG